MNLAVACTWLGSKPGASTKHWYQASVLWHRPTPKDATASLVLVQQLKRMLGTSAADHVWARSGVVAPATLTATRLADTVKVSLRGKRSMEVEGKPPCS